MQKTCATCAAGFEVTDVESNILSTIKVPEPEQCPACRRQQRLLFRNFFYLYHRTCDLTKKKIISMYDEDVPFPVYETHEWWSDRWDALTHGLKWSEDIPFFDQLKTLHETVPRMSVMNTASDNTDYCNMCFYSRNCYLVHGCVNSEDCMYGHIVWRSKDCYDCLYLYQCEWCCECIDCIGCHSLSYSQDCDNCSDSMFLIRCTGCKDCLGCVGLKNKQYYIFNEKHTKEEYQKKLSELQTGSSAIVKIAKEKVRELCSQEIVKNYHGYNSENVTGDYLYNSHNIIAGYDLKECEDSAHIATCESFKDCMDCNFSGTAAEWSYQCLTIEGHSLISCHTCLKGCANLLLCDNCYACKDCIGCVGLKNKQYCILNTQYKKEEYETLKKEIIEHLQSLNEYGTFFPSSMSPFGYNESIAYHYFPLEKEEVLKRGWKWKEEQEKSEQYLGAKMSIPENIADVTDDITSKIFTCESTGKLYKILPQELAFYRQRQLPLPRQCFDARIAVRFAARNPRVLWDRECAKCSKAIQTTYAPERLETVYCESCYLAEVY